MIKYILKRIALMLVTLFIICTLCFVMIHLLPDAPIERGYGVDMGLIDAIGDKNHLNDSILAQFLRYLENIFVYGYFGLGIEMYPKQLVSDVILSKLPYTIMVNLYSILLAIPLGLGFGIYAALKKNKWQDHIISFLVIVFISVPSYVYAFMVQYFICYKLNLFPLTLPSLENTAFFSFDMFVAMLPAILSLSFGVIAGLTRYTRAELSEVLTSEYMMLARAKGLSKFQATSKHALKSAMVVILPMIIGEFIGILSGSLIIEQIFGITGVGQLYVSSIGLRDYNFFMALTIFYTFIGLFAGIVIDISYGFIDPRIRMGSKK